jgi:cytidylate kinase
MVRLQQQLGADGGVVMEGRDIGTVVFPQADVKIFLDAAPEVRGLAPLRAAWPQAPAVQPDEVIRDLRARDERATATAPIRRSSPLPTRYPPRFHAHDARRSGSGG